MRTITRVSSHGPASRGVMLYITGEMNKITKLKPGDRVMVNATEEGTITITKELD